MINEEREMPPERKKERKKERKEGKKEERWIIKKTETMK